MHSRTLYAASAVMFAAGLGLVAAGSYILGKRKAEKEYHERLDEELADARRYYTKLAKKDDYENPSNIVEKKPLFVKIDPEEAWPSKKYVDFDYEGERAKRTKDVPYVISWDEFAGNETDYDQQTVTYFVQDDVLVEERDQPLEPIIDILGPVALDQFGNGSRDPNIVYVRNDRLSMDFEVLRDEGSYEATVLGQIKHSDRPKIRRFRLDDD